MATADQRAIGFMCGGMTTTSVVILVTSFSADSAITATVLDPDDGSTVTTGSVSDTTLAAQKLGGDRGANDTSGQDWFCYYGHITLTGLEPGRYYNLTLAQTSGYAVGGSASAARTPVTQTDQYITTLPGPADDFRLYFGSCDKLTSSNAVGYYDHAYTYVNDPDVLAYMLFIDDWGYVDDFQKAAAPVSDSVTGKGCVAITGKAVKQYNYAYGYGAMLGMLGDTGEDYIAMGRDSNRLNFLLTVPYLMQWGDHEFSNDLGWTDADSGAEFTTIYTAGKTVWDAVFGPLRPPTDIRSADASANHWAITIGPCRIAATDRVTNSTRQWTGGVSGAEAVPGTQFTAMYGANQITDILAALNTNDKFKILMNAYGEKYFTDSLGFYYNINSGQQQPLFNHQPTEYAQLYSGTGSIMDSDKTNQPGYVFLSVHGDTHSGMAMKNQHQAAGQNKENWWSWWIGTWNGANGNRSATQATSVWNAAKPRYTENGDELVYWWRDTNPANVSDAYMAVYGDVVQSDVRGPYLTMNCTVPDSGVVAFSRTYVPAYGNQPYYGAIADLPAAGQSLYDGSSQADGITNADAVEVASNNLICDRTGFKVSVKEGLRKEWTGRMVRKESWEPRHPQDFYRGKSREKQKGSERPEQEDVFLTTNQVQPEDL